MIRSTLFPRASATALIALLSGCVAAPSPPGEGEQPTDARAMAQAPRLLGSCCPRSDSAIYHLVNRYEATAPAAQTPELAFLPYRTNSGIADRREVVVRDAAMWASLWPEIVGSQRPMPPLPPVDFAREMLLVASMGTRSSGGYTIAIDGLTLAGDTLLVAVSEQSPGRNCGVTEAITEPVALARVERSELPVRFRRSQEVTDCQ
jgi:hypothetical protein